MTEPATTTGIIATIFSFISQVTSAIRGFIISMSPQYADFILLGIGAVGGYYLMKKVPVMQKYAVVAYSLVIFLLLRFV